MKKPRKSLVLQILVYLLASLTNPSILVGFLGPLIFQINLLYLQVNLNNPTNFLELREVVSNAWTIAFTDYNAAMFSLMLAIILFYIQLFKSFWPILEKRSAKYVWERIKDSIPALSILIVAIAFFLLFLILLANGWFGTPETIAQYYPSQNVEIFGLFDFPPLGSIITWGRVIVVLLGAASYSQIEKMIPEWSRTRRRQTVRR